MREKFFIVALAVLLLVGAGGCITIKKEPTAVSNLGGVFYSEDRWEKISPKSLLMTPGETPGSIVGVDALFVKFDPNDEEALYLGTRANGLYYSWNGGEGWNKVLKLTAGMVRDLAIDTKDKCRLYAAVDNKIFKSEDCARTWKSVWYSDSETKIVTALAVDWYDPKVVYTGLSDGSLLKSEDFGQSWKMLNRKWQKRVAKITLDPNDSRVLYVAILSHGLYKSVDKGENWTDLMPAMKDYKNSGEYFDFAVAKSSPNLLIYASRYGLLRSQDGGDTWTEVKLLSKPGQEPIYSVAIDPTNANYLYYGTDKALYKTIDGGQNWINKKMPTSRVASSIAISPSKPARVIFGVKEVVEQNNDIF